MLSDCNVIFIIIDALRARNLSCYGYPKQTTPNIDALAKKGVLFENAFSCTNITDSSITTIFSGKYPINHGVISHGVRLQEKDLRRIGGISFLHEILKSHGYVTLAVDWLKRWHRRNYDVYYDPYHGEPDPQGRYSMRGTHRFKILKAIADVLRFFGMNRIYRRGKRILKYGREAEVVTDVAVKLIKENASNKFFIFLHYWDAHWTYNPPKSYTEKFYRHEGTLDDRSIEGMLSQIQSEGWRAPHLEHVRNAPNLDYVLAQYDGAIANVDHEIGRLMDLIDRHHLSEKTFIVLTSDHGESLTEHGIFFDHHGLYDVSIHIPLILVGPGLPEGRRVNGLTQHVDLVPTLLEILNIPISQEETFDGTSLMPLINGEKEELRSAIFAEEAYFERKRAIRTTRYKYMRALSKKAAMCICCKCIHGGLEELYDLSKDPQETQNIAEEEPKVTNELRKKLSRWVKSFERVEVEEELKEKYKPSYEEEREVMERLRKLGYF